MALIFVLSSTPKLPQVQAFFDVNTLAHIVFFAILCGLGERAFFFQDWNMWLRSNSFKAAFVLTCVYGIMDEIHQRYVPGRLSDINDVIADSFGALLVLVWLRLRFGGFRRTYKEPQEAR